MMVVPDVFCVPDRARPMLGVSIRTVTREGSCYHLRSGKHRLEGQNQLESAWWDGKRTWRAVVRPGFGCGWVMTLPGGFEQLAQISLDICCPAWKRRGLMWRVYEIFSRCDIL